MNDVAKYEIELKSKDNKYTTVRIGGLKMAYYKDGDGKLFSFGGICALIRNKEYEGYCNLCMSYHSFKSVDLPKPGYIVEFSPLYNVCGQMILIKYDHDDICAHIDRGGYRDYHNNEIADASLTFFNHGCFTEFNKEK